MAGQMDKAMKLLPSTIEQATKGTPICELAKVTGERNIHAFVAFELVSLASMLNVDERLNLQPHQVQIIAEELCNTFRNENLADFHICFRRGAMGHYDEKLLRLDGAVITQWMKKYLEEKYQVIEDKLMRERDHPYLVRNNRDQTKNQINADRNLLAAMEVVLNGKDPGVDMSKHLEADELKEYEENKKKLSSIKPEPNNANNNAYERYKLDNPYRYFDVRGLKILARTQEQAEKIVEEMIKSGEVEEC
jgi:hypothetical protein